MRASLPTSVPRGTAVWQPCPPRIVAAALVGAPGGSAIALPRPARAAAWSAQRRRNFRRHTAVPLLCLVAGASTIAWGYVHRARPVATPISATPRPAPEPVAPTLPPPTVPRVTVDRPRVLPAEVQRPPTARADRRQRPAARPKARPATPPIAWRHSRSIGLPYGGRLEDGVQLPAAGRDFVTVNPIGAGENAGFRRWSSDRLVRLVLRVSAQYRRLHPHGGRMMVGDMSLKHGGPFVGFGGLGHHSHQNGLDVDIPYPRRDGREVEPQAVAEIDHRAAQDLVDLWVRAGAQFVFVGPNTGLTGPGGIVQTLVYHDDHMHVRIPG